MTAQIFPRPMLPADPYICPVCDGHFPNTRRSWVEATRAANGGYDPILYGEGDKRGVMPICSLTCFYKKHPKPEAN